MYLMMAHLDFEVPEDLIKELEEKTSEAIDELAEEVEWEWRKIVARDLHQSKEEYFKGMSVERVGDEIHMKVTGALAVAVESGSSRFDLKPGFLKGKSSANIPLFGNRPPNRDRFRKVPSNKKPWIHPGIKAHNLTGKVQQKVEEDLVREVFTRVIGRIKV